MTAEQRPGIPQLLGTVLENAVPFLRNHRISVEQAKRSLEFAWSTLGGETGRDVTEEQIRAVLHGELRVLQSYWLRISTPIYADEKYFQQALKFHTVNGLSNAGTFMFVKADHWREVAFIENESRPDSEAFREAQRRALACDRANDLLLRKHLRI